MKRLVFPLLFLFPLWLLAQEAQITFRAIGGAGKTVRTTKPVNGNYFWATQTIDTLDADGVLRVANGADVPGVYLFHFGQKSYRIYARPGENFEVIVDADNAVQPLQIIGPQSAGQLTFNRHERPFYQDEGYANLKEYPAFEEAKQKVLEQVSEELEPFEQLFEAGKIDEGFFQVAEATIRSYYASVLIVSLFEEHQRLVVHPDSAGYDDAAIANYLDKWDAVSGVQDVFDERAAMADSYFYLSDLYAEWYFSCFDPETREPILKKPETPDGYWERPYWAIHKVFEGKLQEHLLATRIHHINVQNRFQPFQLDIFADFTDAYPNSIYTPYLREGIANVSAYLEKVKADFGPEHRFVDDYSAIDSFEELAQRFKGKTVYVDLWATWCGPCKSEFAYNEGLKAFAKEQGVEVLYVSVDRDEADQQWKDMIKYYDLTGHHIRTSKALGDDIRSQFTFEYNGQQVFGIPYYIILKDGEVVVKEANRPSAGEALYEQIAEYL